MGEGYIPYGLAYDLATNTLYSGYSDGVSKCRLLAVTSTGVVRPVAGSGTCGYSGDGGPAKAAQIEAPLSVAVDGSGNVYMASFYAVRRVSRSTGVITVFAGNSRYNCFGESPPPAVVGSTASLVAISAVGMAIDPISGHLFIANACGREIVEVDEESGIVVGNYGGEPNSQAMGALAFDPEGNLYFASGGFGQQVRKMSTSGRFSLIAGNGTHGITGNGRAATAATLDEVQGLVVDSRGVLFISAFGSGGRAYIRQVSTSGTISAVAGAPWPGNFPAPVGTLAGNATFHSVGALTVDARDGLYVADPTGRTLIAIGAYAETRRPIRWILHDTIQSLGSERRGGRNPSAHSCDQGCVGDPVNTATGEYWETSTDLAIPGRGPALAFERTYGAQSAELDGRLGYGWTAAYSMALSVDEEGDVAIRQENGSEITFESDGRGGYTAPDVYLATLVANEGGGWTLTRRSRDIFTFDAEGLLVSEADLNGETTALSYDEAGNLSRITDAGGRTFTLEYNEAGRIRELADSAGRTVRYAYTSGDLTSVTDVRGETWRYAYDGQHRLLSRTDPNGHLDVLNEYDAADRVVQQTDGREGVTRFSYEPGVTEITSPDRRVRQEYYASGQLIQRIDGAGTAGAATWRYEYDPDTRGTTKVTDPNGHIWLSTYDSEGRPTSTTDPLEHSTYTSYDELGDPLTLTDANSITTTSTYDENGNLLSTSTPLTGTEENQVTRFVRGDESHPGDVTEVVDPRRKTTQLRYDAFGNLTSITDALGNETTTSYDSAGRVRAVVSPRGNEARGSPEAHTTNYVRDAAGAVTQVTDPLGNVTRSTYDAAGNLEATTDAKRQVTTYDYDAGDLQTAIHRADRTTLRTSYDGDENVTDTTDGAGNTTRYAYDELGRQSTVTDPARRITTFHYDRAGNTTSMDDAQARITRYAYDNANRPRTITYSDRVTPTVTFGYDNAGQRTSMRDGSGSSTYVYDSLHRLYENTDGAGRTVRYGYDLANELTSLTYTNGRTIERAYDDAGRLESVTDWLGGTTRFDYDADSNLLRTTFPTASEEVDTSTYDDANELRSTTFAKGASTLARLTYTRDRLGLPTAIEQTGLPGSATARSTYTALNQLASHDSKGYEYDAADNLTNIAEARPLAYNASNELTEGPVAPGGAGRPAAFAYDLDGNRTSATPERGTATRYAYDQADRLTRYTPAAGSAATYVYDGDGLRTKKTIGAAVTRFAWDHSGGLPLLLSDAANSYVYGPGDIPLEQIDGSGVVTYYHHDEIGSTRLLTSSRGAVNATFTYDPYGSLAARTGSQTTPLGFAGQYTDAESGLQYLRARYLDPATGQFLTRDPLTAATRTPYSYAGGNPLAATDPSGLSWVGNIGMFVSDAAAGALNEISFGLSNRIAGVDGSCAGRGYGWGSGVGFAGSFLTGSGEAKALFYARRMASTPTGRLIQSFRRGDDGWVQTSAHAEGATGRRYRGGINLEEVFERGNDRLIHHRIYSEDGRLLHDNVRDYAKFGRP